MRLVWDLDFLHFAQYISISPHGIDCKQTWCKKIYCMDRVSWLKPLMFEHCIISYLANTDTSDTMHSSKNRANYTKQLYLNHDICFVWQRLPIRLFPMLVATGCFSPEMGLPVIFCVDFNHFKTIIMNALLHRKTLICSFLNQFRLLFICYQRKFNLVKPSLWICHSNMIRMYKTMDRNSVFTHAATWWSSTLESSNMLGMVQSYTFYLH